MFFSLEWKSFVRSAGFKANMFIKIIMVLAALYFILVFTALGVGMYYILQKQGLPPLETVNRFLIIYLLIDLVIRYFLQKMPVMNIRPFLVQNILRKNIVAYSLGKTLFSIFNILHLFLLLPLTIVLIVEGFDPAGAIAWFIGVSSLILVNNFLNILSNNKSIVLYSVALILAAVALFHLLWNPGYYSLYPTPV